LNEEIKETVFIAIGLILIASVLTFLMAGLKMRGEFADIRNRQIQTLNNTKEYREFNKYNGLDCDGTCKNHLSGWEVLAAIREYSNNDGIEIYVDRDKYGNEFIMHSTLVRANPDDYEIGALQDRFSTSNSYHPMLVYDGANPKNTTEPQNKDSSSTVTGIRFTLIN